MTLNNNYNKNVNVTQHISSYHCNGKDNKYQEAYETSKLNIIVSIVSRLTVGRQYEH